MKRYLQFVCCMTAILCAATTVLSQTPGTLKWAFSTGGQVRSSLAIGADGTIYVGSWDHKLYAINPDGSRKWTFTAADEIQSSPAIGADGTIYVGSSYQFFNSPNNKLYAINPDGTPKWDFTPAGAVDSSPAIGVDGTIYVGSRDGKLYAMNPDGTLKWAFKTDFINSSPAIGADGTIYIGSFDKKLYALNPNGTQKWAFITGGIVDSSPAIDVDGTIYLGSRDKKLYAINPDGSQKWAFTTGDIVTSSAAIGTDGTIYVGSHDNKLYAINPNGTQKWTFATNNAVSSSPAIGADGTIYVGSYDKFYAINPDGTQKLVFTIDGSGFAPGIIYSSPAIGPDGVVYIGGANGNSNLYAIYSSSNGLASSSWPKFRHDNRNVGRVPPKTKDVGVAALEAPSFATVTVGNSVQIRVVVGNFGTEAQSNFPVSYQINTETPVTENFIGTLQPNATTTITFATPWQPVTLGTYTIIASTGLSGDELTGNDRLTKTVLVTQSQIFCSTETPKSIPDANTLTSTLTINDDLRIGDLNVRLFISHTNDTDLDVFLTSPSGTKVELFTDVGGSGDNFGSTCSPLPDCILDDQATTSIASGNAPFVGSFRSESQMLGAFAAENAKGTWTLSVTDDASGSSGTLNCWCLEINPAKPNDVGVTAIDLPRVLTLGNSLTVNVTVKNFGIAAQSNFPVRYSINNGPAVTENFVGTLTTGASATKTFASFTPAAEGAYRFTAWTELSGDQNAANDTLPNPKIVRVRKTNIPPMLATISHQTVRAGRAKRLTLSVMDAEADTVSFSIPTNPGFLSISGVTRSGNLTTATLAISPARNLKGIFNARVQVKTIDGEAASAFNVEIVPATLNPPRNLAATDAGNAVTLNWEAPLPAQLSPYAGKWSGSSSQSLPVYMEIADDNFVDSLNARIRMSFFNFTCTANFTSGIAEIKNAKFDAFLSIPITNVSTTYHGTFSSDSTVSGAYDGHSGAYFVLCGDQGEFGTGGTQLSAGTWQARRTIRGSAVLAVLQSFNLYRSSQPNVRTTGVLIGNVNANLRTFTDSNPSPGALYYQITSKYDQGESDPTNDAGIRTRVENRITDLPIVYALEQNYPNPFNPETTILFQLPKAGHAVLKIFNIIGAEVLTLVDEPFTAGYHRVRWDGKDNHGNLVTSGIYLYRLRVGNFSQVKKMSLIR